MQFFILHSFFHIFIHMLVKLMLIQQTVAIQSKQFPLSDILICDVV